MNLDNIQIPEQNEDVNVEVKEGIFVNLKDIINVLIAFINKLIKFEFLA